MPGSGEVKSLGDIFDEMFGALKVDPTSTIVSVPQLMAHAMKTFTERQAVYSKDGPGFEKHGKILSILFPNGLELKDPESLTRWVLFNNVLTKVCRYAENMNTGGHLDSVHDIGVYAFILEAHDRNARAG